MAMAMSIIIFQILCVCGSVMPATPPILYIIFFPFVFLSLTSRSKTIVRGVSTYYIFKFLWHAQRLHVNE